MVEEIIMLELLNEKPVLWIPYSNPKEKLFSFPTFFSCWTKVDEAFTYRIPKLKSFLPNITFFYGLASGGLYSINMNTMLNTLYKTQLIDFIIFNALLSRNKVKRDVFTHSVSISIH